MKQVFFNVGDVVASYRIEAFVARGGMAMVYRARDTRLDRSVALKLLAPELSQNDNFRQRFMRESQLAAACDHPNIIPIYEAGEVEDRLFIAMRYVEGLDLRALLDEEGALQMDRALDLFFQVGSALDAAHARGLVHRDVKPGNILVASGAGREDTDHVYLTDFGLTKRSMSLTGYTTAGHFLGTIDYIAPEQIAGKAVDARADIYALACVLYEALAAVPPFQRDDDAAMLWAHLSAPPPRLRERRPDLPEHVDHVLARALAKDPDDRFRTCREFLGTLRPPLTRSSPGAPEHGPARGPVPLSEAGSPLAKADRVGSSLLGSPDAGADVQEHHPAERTRGGHRKRWAPPVAALAVAVIATVAAVAGLSRHSGSTTLYNGQDVPVSFKYPREWGAKVHGLTEGANRLVVARAHSDELISIVTESPIPAELATPDELVGLFVYPLKSRAETSMSAGLLLPKHSPSPPDPTTTASCPLHILSKQYICFKTVLLDASGNSRLQVVSLSVSGRQFATELDFFYPPGTFEKNRPTFQRILDSADFR